MKHLNKIVGAITLCTMFGACSLLEADLDNTYEESRLYEDAAFAEGLLLYAYDVLPDVYDWIEVATDDALTNDKTNEYRSMATGTWSAISNPADTWVDGYAAIAYLNKFLAVVDSVEWSWKSEYRDSLYNVRFTGEALALRAYYHFNILMAHGGKASDGSMLGVPYITEPLDYTDEWNLSRPSFTSTVESILADLNAAIGMLAEIYDSGSDSDYNLVNGDGYVNRINGLIARALKARVAMYAASPNFNNGSYDAAYCDTAIVAAAYLIDYIGGVGEMENRGDLDDAIFYDKSSDKSNDEILWRMDYEASSEMEEFNFPPSLYGEGGVNPSQNFVDAFPMADGTPITAAGSSYDPSNPYSNRDPRLDEYVIYHGSEYSDAVISMVSESSNADGVNVQTNSTRTGYYLKKLLRSDVNLNPSAFQTQDHYIAIMRYTELFLIYAEAVTEAWGADADPYSLGYTPRDIILTIRERAGIEGDTYAAAATGTEFRDLLRNERRIELSFEGFRFWDMRRWGLDLTESISGITVKEVDGVAEYTIVENIESRAYQSYMTYGPIPYSEILKCSNLLQNTGW